MGRKMVCTTKGVQLCGCVWGIEMCFYCLCCYGDAIAFLRQCKQIGPPYLATTQEYFLVCYEIIMAYFECVTPSDDILHFAH